MNSSRAVDAEDPIESAVVDSKGRPPDFIVTDEQVLANQLVDEVLSRPRSPSAIMADKAYDSEKVRQEINDECAVPLPPLIGAL